MNDSGMSAGLNSTPSGDRVHIGIFGKRNAGKSGLINAITGQSLSIVSDVKGTTTDPVQKAMELLPLGPVVIIDTPGIDDTGELGSLRVKRSYQMLNKTDVAVIVYDGTEGFSPEDAALEKKCIEKNIPYIIVANKLDKLTPSKDAKEAPPEMISPAGKKAIWVSALTGENISLLKETIAASVPEQKAEFPIVSDLLKPGDIVVLVIPIDKAAPKGRLILPQQQTIRDILEARAVSVVTPSDRVVETIAELKKSKTPRLVVTDSQVFAEVSKAVPEDIELTSFSILFARHKGNLYELVRGVSALESLKDGDNILISEGCTHHRQCGDIGTEKLPLWISSYTGKKLNFSFTSGTEFPTDLSPYSMVIHCGGCMLNEREMKYRISCASDQGIPIANYGLIIAQTKGILKRSLKPFPKAAALLKNR